MVNFRKLLLKFDLGAAAWLEIKTARRFLDNYQNVGRRLVHKGTHRQLWVEKFRNKGGVFQKISVNKNFMVPFVMIPEGN